ncbi:urease subunit beta [Mammaliicoccus stepanovicii]|uniref:Urease subunit beta n=1 Tax=Mammaliicoccus stepanovicii TaxID=643214 RepID=A0A239Y8R5_9STAP|nr:urease subunit beta [Mammaliicoccus stepanovicii]GGI43263.1 urease subunit beta [Mammaliicoccus stepanovicii]SNV54578.1 urease subunit beta [Mammaliicoccus stepanovicii]
MKPGEIISSEGTTIINKDHDITIVNVKNVGDRPIQVGSHFHFYETNKGLSFEREKAYGKRLDIPAGAAVRFEPGDEKEIHLIEYSGKRKVFGFRNLVDGQLDEDKVYKPEK